MLTCADVDVAVSAEELKPTGRNSIKLTDGSGYIVSLGVFHQLHCLVFQTVPYLWSILFVLMVLSKRIISAFSLPMMVSYPSVPLPYDY